MTNEKVLSFLFHTFAFSMKRTNSPETTLSAVRAEILIYDLSNSDHAISAVAPMTDIVHCQKGESGM